MSLTKQDQNYNIQFDMLRSLAIIGVLIIHSMNRYTVGSPVAPFFELFTILVRPCIAIFLFLSGALFVIKPIDLKQLKKRLTRTIVPYFIFSLFALYYTYKIGLFSVILHRPIQLLINILVGNTLGIYYFVFIIVVMYLMDYILLANDTLRRYIIPILFVAYAINLIHTAYGYQLWHTITAKDLGDYSIYADRSPFLWACFFIAGIVYQQQHVQYYIDRWRSSIRIIWILICTLYIILFFSPLPKPLIDGYHSPMGSVYALSTIFFLLTFPVKSLKWSYLSERSYFIYLLHIFIVYGLLNAIYAMQMPAAPWMSLLSFALSLILSLLFYELFYRAMPPSKRWLLGMNR